MKKKRLLTDRSGQLHEDLENELAKTLQEEIDAEIMQSMLRDCGWHKVIIARRHKPEKDIVEQWVKGNVKDGFWTHGPTWLFKNPKEANWFALRWS